MPVGSGAVRGRFEAGSGSVRGRFGFGSGSGWVLAGVYGGRLEAIHLGADDRPLPPTRPTTS